MPKAATKALDALKRNQACHQCRKRKLRCDAKRPCTTCVKSYAYSARLSHPVAIPPMECTYDEFTMPELEQRPASPERLEQLEERIKTLESMLKASSIRSHPDAGLSSETSGSELRTEVGPPAANDEATTSSQSRSPLSIPRGIEDLDSIAISVDSRSNSDPPSISSNIPHFPYDALSSELSMVTDLPAAGVPLPLTDIPTTDPWWPSALPHIDLLLHLVETFFACLPHAGRLLHREKFLASIGQSPNSPLFPIPALLHAICAIASFYTVVVDPLPLPDFNDLPDEEIFPEGRQAIPKRAFGECHALWSNLSAYRASERGLNMIQILQANVVLQWYHYLAGSNVTVWSLNGKACRILPALGLNVAENCNTLSRRADQPHVIPDARTVTELEGRRNLMWLLYIGERLVAAQNPWAMLVDDNDISQFLPVSDLDFNEEHEYPKEVRQRLSTPNMLFNHPPYLNSSFALLVKSVYLLSRVKTFNVRFRNLNGDEVDPRSSPEFVVLDDWLSRFRSSWPRDSTPISHNGRVDATLYLADLIPNVATILLHDPHADFGDPRCRSAARIVDAVSLIMDAVYKITNTSYDLMLLDQFTSFCWFTAGTSLVRIGRSKLDDCLMGDVIKLNSEFEMIKHLLRRIGERTVLGRRHLKLLNEHYDAELCPHRQTSLAKVHERRPGMVSVSEIIYNVSRPASSRPTKPVAPLPVQEGLHFTELFQESGGQIDWTSMILNDR